MATILLLFGILFIIAMIFSRLSEKMGIPVLLIFLGIGILFGSDVLNVIYFDNALLAKQVADVLLIFILFEGGFRIPRQVLRTYGAPSLVLASFGVLITALALGLAIHFVLGMDLWFSLMVASIVSSTDASGVFLITRQYPLKEKIAATITIESAANDPMAILLTLATLSVLEGNARHPGLYVVSLVWQFGGGILVAFVVAKLSVLLFKFFNSKNRGNYTVLMIGLILSTYGLSELIQANGIIGVFFLGYWLGNASYPAKQSMANFLEGITGFANVGLFLMLGLLAFPHQLVQVWQLGLIITGLLVFVVRPFMVFLLTLPFKYSFAEKLCISWAGIKGVVPIVLATYPLVAGKDQGIVFNVVFFVVLISSLVQGLSLGPLARALRLTTVKRAEPSHIVELHSLKESDVELLEFHIQQDSQGAYKRIADLGLGDQGLISAIIRQDRLVLPKGRTVLEPGDIVYVMVPRDQIQGVRKQLG